MAPTATARKTPAPAAEVVEYDFDSWTQEDEDAALRALNDVRYIIVEGNFVGRFSDGAIVKIPLSLSTSTIEELQTEFDTPIDQFKHLLETIGGGDVAIDLGQRSIIAVAILAEKYFRAIARAQELAFPES